MCTLPLKRDHFQKRTLLKQRLFWLFLKQAFFQKRDTIKPRLLSKIPVFQERLSFNEVMAQRLFLKDIVLEKQHFHTS